MRKKIGFRIFIAQAFAFGVLIVLPFHQRGTNKHLAALRRVYMAIADGLFLHNGQTIERNFFKHHHLPATAVVVRFKMLAFD